MVPLDDLLPENKGTMDFQWSLMRKLGVRDRVQSWNPFVGESFELECAVGYQGAFSDRYRLEFTIGLNVDGSFRELEQQLAK